MFILVDTLTINSDEYREQDSSTETLSSTEHSLPEELDATEDGLSYMIVIPEVIPLRTVQKFVGR